MLFGDLLSGINVHFNDTCDARVETRTSDYERTAGLFQSRKPQINLRGRSNSQPFFRERVSRETRLLNFFALTSLIRDEILQFYRASLYISFFPTGLSIPRTKIWSAMNLGRSLRFIHVSRDINCTNAGYIIDYNRPVAHKESREKRESPSAQKVV